MTFIVIYLILPMAYPTLHKESFGFILIMISLTNLKMVNTIVIFTVLWICLGAFALANFGWFFLLLFLGDIITMLHDVGLLDAAVELDRLTTLCFVAGAGFLSLCGRCAA